MKTAEEEAAQDSEELKQALVAVKLMRGKVKMVLGAFRILVMLEFGMIAYYLLDKVLM